MKNVFALAIAATSIISPLFTAPALAAPSRNDVYVGGENIGSDPDANVRLDLQREYNSRNGGF
jgi:hypothetical protein